MTFTVLKETLQEILSTASRFTLSKITSVSSLQGGLLKTEKGKLTIITTNLNDFFSSELKIGNKEKKGLVVDIKKVVEFLSFLPAGQIEVSLEDKQMRIKSKKTTASFSTMSAEDFPFPPQTEGKRFVLKKGFLEKNLPLILFAVAKDESRPILTGVNFLSREDGLYLVATDGFRLSLLKEKKTEDIPPLIISSTVLSEILRLLPEKEEVGAVYSEKEKTVLFTIGKSRIYSRIIEGDFPPFEKVIPADYKTRAVVEKDEFLRNVKLASVFARDLSNIIILEIKKDGLSIRPRGSQEEGTVASQEAEIEGEEQKIAFNYKFVLDFLNNIKGKKIIFQMTEPNAPGLFKAEKQEDYLHIIMPVRTEQESS